MPGYEVTHSATWQSQDLNPVLPHFKPAIKTSMHGYFAHPHLAGSGGSPLPRHQQGDGTCMLPLLWEVLYCRG